MNRRSSSTSFIACAIAYAIAIQAILLGFGAVSAATPGGAPILCADVRGGDAPETPAGHADMQCCIAACCSGIAGVPPERAVVGPSISPGASSVVHAIPAAQFSDWPSERPRSSRAPPV